MKEFARDGVSFRFPENWQIEDEEGDDGWTVSLTSPDTAFAVFSLRPDARDPADLADQTLDAFKAEYKELDAENTVETIAGQVAIGHNIDFLTVDTATTVHTRCLNVSVGPFLIMTQVSEYDRQRNEPVLHAIIASLKIDEE
jgi:hypothetical protein